jgi:hypothetical protein
MSGVRTLVLLLLLALLVLAALRVREAGRDRGRRPAVPEAETPTAPPPAVAAPARSLPEFEVRVVVEPHGDPLVGVEVRVEWQSGDPQEARTDERGVARFKLEAGRQLRRCTVAATPETPTRSVTDFRVDPDFLEIRVPRAGRLTGRVNDPEGRPIGGATILGRAVAHRGRPGFEPEPELRPLAVSGGDGVFVIEGLSGRFLLRAGGGGLEPLVEAEGDLGPGEEIEELLLVSAPPRALTGKVVDADGNPVAEALVHLLDPSPGWPGKTLGPSRAVDLDLDVRTDEQGLFTLERVPRAPLEIEVASMEHHDEPRPLAPDADHVVVTLGPSHLPATLEGIVRTREGQPVAGAELQLAAPSLGSMGRSDEGGRFRIETRVVRDPRYPFRGPFRLLATAPRFAFRRLEWPTLGPGENRVEVVLDRERVISGTLVDGQDRPIPGANVHLREVEETRPGLPVAFEWTETGGLGRFRFGQLPEGEFLLSHGWRPAVTVQAGATGIVLRPGGSVHVTIRFRDARDGRALENPFVMIRDEGGGHGSRKNAPGGVYRAPPRSPGRFGFGVRVDGYARRAIPLRDWTAGEHEVTLDLHPATPLRLRLLDENGEPVVGARVVPQWPDGEPMSFDDTDPARFENQLPKSGWSGRCWFERLPATRIRLSILPPDAPEPFLRELDLGSHDGSERDIRVP